MDISKKRACCACHHRRRKCSPDCPFAPYFPADEPKMFANAHRLFGISGMLKTLKKISDDEGKDAAMKSMIFESDVRANFPVHGCLGVIIVYQSMIQKHAEELDRVKKVLSLFQQHNLVPDFSVDHSLIPSTSSQIPSFPVFNNVGE
ncbi:LOB domain-containing protein 27-like [Vicia villosa]|uniref:LOB domain-containing protein 27-like n=1 Tax=Vicia villosa TaxID=3911 RepID=UPI00273AC13E|nr:LOB domain-containing protein 27-like [Vicia villosa]